MDSWPEWRDKIIQFSKVEATSRPCMKKLLIDLEKKESVACPDGESFIVEVASFPGSPIYKPKRGEPGIFLYQCV